MLESLHQHYLFERNSLRITVCSKIKKMFQPMNNRKLSKKLLTKQAYKSEILFKEVSLQCILCVTPRVAVIHIRGLIIDPV